MHIKNCTKLFLLTTLLSVALSSTFAQKSAIGFHVTGTEYDGDLNSNRHKYYQFKFLQPGGGISLQQYLNPSFNMVEMVSYDRVQYQNDTKTQGVDAQFFTLNIKFKYKFNNGYIFKEGAAISPFIIAGLGATYIMSKQFAIAQSAKITDGAVKANIAAGAGIYFRFNDAVGLELANTINMPLFDEWDGVTNSSNDLYLQHSVGLIFALSKPKDTDKDGVPDKKDKCANTPKGVKVDATGCPIDADGDGVPDYLDKCPALKGIEVLNGCPDTDGDGVADIDDRCPSLKGNIANKGCPEITKQDAVRITYIGSKLFFENNSDKLKVASLSQLDELTKILNKYEGANLVIEGHTDSNGSDEFNTALSQKRTESVRAYLIEKGISSSRLTGVGMGESKPVATNTTSLGRAKNRRVELKTMY